MSSLQTNKKFFSEIVYVCPEYQKDATLRIKVARILAILARNLSSNFSSLGFG